MTSRIRVMTLIRVNESRMCVKQTQSISIHSRIRVVYACIMYINVTEVFVFLSICLKHTHSISIHSRIRVIYAYNMYL